MHKKELIQELKRIGVISFEPVVLRSGAVSDFYCDIKKAYGYPHLLDMFADEVGRRLPPGTTCVAGSGHGGLPLATAVAARFGTHLICVRDKAKDHGKKKLLDGYEPGPDDRIVIVDDVLTSGSSIRAAFAVLQEADITASAAIVVVKRGDPELPVPCESVLSVEELRD